MKLLLVEWVDSCSCHSWAPRDEEHHIVKITSIGILAEEDDKEIKLIPNISPTQELHQICIPKGTIKRMRRIKIG